MDKKKVYVGKGQKLEMPYKNSKMQAKALSQQSHSDDGGSGMYSDGMTLDGVKHGVAQLQPHVNFDEEGALDFGPFGGVRRQYKDTTARA